MGWQLNCDGGARGNPGIAGCGIYLTKDGETQVAAGWYLGKVTNNHAEYCGLIWGLENALACGVRTLEVRADSELIVKQMRGEYKVKNRDLKLLNERARRLIGHFDFVNIEHVYRKDNKEADFQANEAMDALGPVGTWLVDFEADERQSDTAPLFMALAQDPPNHARDVASGDENGHEKVSDYQDDAACGQEQGCGQDCEQDRDRDSKQAQGHEQEQGCLRLGKTVLVGVTGCIAAYKACELIRCLQKKDPDLIIKVVMTDHATSFVGAATFRALTGCEVAVGLFDDPHAPIHHISLAKEADVVCIAPATANVIAKLAHGVADDLLTTTALATDAPLVVAPAMNSAMWTDDATRENVATLKERGIEFVGPDTGHLACGDEGAGRMADPERIADAIIDVLDNSCKLSGKRVLVTAGPTREPIDSVRYLSNKSSGKQGYAIASQAAAMGAQVTLVSGPVEIPVPRGVDVVYVETADEMLEACRKPFELADAAIFVAAVSDWKCAQVAEGKISHNAAPLALELIPNPDIAATLAGDKGDTFVVVFAAEAGNPADNAAAKLKSKGADLAVGNDISSEYGFGSDDNHVWLVDDAGVEELPVTSKRSVAREILSRIRWA